MKRTTKIVLTATLAATWAVSAIAADSSYSLQELTEAVQTGCGVCHNDQLLTGGLSLQHYDVAQAAERAPITEKIILKLRAGMMPPPGIAIPTDELLDSLVSTLETRIDSAAALNPNPGNRSFQRLNQAEYEAAIRELLTLDIEAEDFLPLDTKSANFDNIVDAQLLSPTLLSAYLNAAAEISQLAIGDVTAVAKSTTYTNSAYTTQWDRVEGAPFGTRGGISMMHNFPADGEYIFRMAFEHTTTGGFFGNTTRGEQLEVSIDGVRAMLLEVDQWMNVSDPNGANMESIPLFVPAGPHRISAVFLKQSEGPLDDLVSPHEWSLTDRQIGVGGYGVTALAHLKDLVVSGPFNTTGVSETPSRRAIFSCRPTSADEEIGCAEEIIDRLANGAYRGQLDDDTLQSLMEFYLAGANAGGFESGIRIALQAILASPDFVFRFEEIPVDAQAGDIYQISDFDLASRLSFFLWGSPPDAELLSLAEMGTLSDPITLEQQVNRMLDDSKITALGPRFAGQWLRLEDLEKVHPDRLLFPDYSEQLADAMRTETEMLFTNIVQEDDSAMELFTADYTFVNERLAKHYGIDSDADIIGNQFQRVNYPDNTRQGILGHGSVLTLTSHAGRTSPVLRGKWVMEVLLGTPPPPPPPDVPDLENIAEFQGGKMLTTRERMEEHRSNPVCRSCHQYMDPIGLALDNFDVTGKWRIRENGMPLDTRGQLYDGTPLSSPADIYQALSAKQVSLIRNFTSNLMAYALGRRVEYYDMPTIRNVVAEAKADEYRMSSFIMGIVKSDAFQKRKLASANELTGEVE